MTDPVKLSDHARGVMQAARSRTAMMYDSLKNMMTGLGTSMDKNAHATYALTILDKGQLENAYRCDWVARKTVTIPPYDATKEWRSWRADPAVIEKIENTEKRLGLLRRVAWVMTKDRLYGGAALVMGIGDDDPSQPLIVDGVKQDSLRYVHVLSKYELSTSELVRDPSSPFFGLPEFYDINGATGSVARARVHHTRVVRFVENEIPDISLHTDGWGDSVLMALDDAVKNVGLTAGGIATLVAEAKNDVLSIPDFMENVGNAEYRTRLLERVSLAQVSKSSQNTMIIDKEEIWNRINQSFTGLPDIYKLYLLVAAGAADIPVTRFLSQSATGLGATGDENTRNYDDRISSDQKVRIGPTLRPLDEVIIRSATGARDPSIWYDWNPLRKSTPAEQAELESKRATTAKTYYEMGAIPEEIFQEMVIDRLIDDGTFPTLETLWEEYEPPEEKELDERDPNVEGQFGKSKAKPGEDEDDADNDNEKIEISVRKKTETGDTVRAVRSVLKSEYRLTRDARLQTLYVRRDLKNKDDLLAWARTEGIEVEKADELHVTIVYSRTEVDWLRMGEGWNFGEDLTVKAGGPRYLDILGPPGAEDTLVLSFASSELGWRHEQLKREGCVTTYPEYQPHVSLRKGERGELEVLIKRLTPYRGELVFGPEIFEEVKK